MRKVLSAILIAFCLYNCTSDSDSPKTGDIYGVITEKSTAEPMKATGVELYTGKVNTSNGETELLLLLKTVTYDDGHYEFNELAPGQYKLKVVAESYDDVFYDVKVEAGRTARADMQLSKKNPTIYGRVTTKDSAEPIKDVGVALYTYSYWDYDRLEVQTVTSDSGYYEFFGLQPNTYQLKIVTEDYKEVTQKIKIDTGKTVKADIQLEKMNTGMTINISGIKLSLDKKEALIQGTYTTSDYSYSPNEIGVFYAQAADSLSKSNNVTATINYSGRSYSATIKNLKKGTYYIQVYAKNKIGRTLSGIDQLEITGDPVVTTLPVANITAEAATLNGRIEYPGEPAYTGKGFVYSTTFPNPTIDDPEESTTKVAITGTSEEFSANIANLAKDVTKEVTYYVRAYATNESGTVYGESISFTTDPKAGKPVVVTLPATNITTNSATLNGKIEYEGDIPYTERGFVYSNSFSNPTLENPEDATVKVKVSGRNPEFSVNISGLEQGTNYSVRAYVINANGTEYGESISLRVEDYAVILKEAGIAVQKLDISNGKVSKKLAEELCAASSVEGYNDWRLPTLSELTSMYNNKSLLSGIKTGSYDYYWSSTQKSIGYYYQVNMYSGKIYYDGEDVSYYYNGTGYSYYARCVRSLQ